MAREDLYKTARQSAKLFKLVQEGQELESWVSKKITKAAADIESVYQYLNFEKHFNEQEKAIMSNTSISEATREELRGKLLEAKAKVAAMKKKAAKEKSEKMDESDLKVGQSKNTRTGKLTQVDAHTQRHINTSYKDDGDEIASNAKSGKGIKSHAKAQSAAEKKEKAPALKKSKTGTWGMENGEKFDNRKVSEAKAKCCCEEKGKAKCPVHGKMDEAKDRVMTRAAKGNEKYGKDGMKALAKAGREGKSLEPVKAKYNKYDEAKELKGGQKKLDKDHNGKLDKKDFELLRNKKNIKEAIARAQIALDEGKKKSAGKKPAWLEKAEVEAEEKSGKKVSKAEEKKVGINESTEFARMKTLMTRLNG